MQSNVTICQINLAHWLFRGRSSELCWIDGGKYTQPDCHHEENQIQWGMIGGSRVRIATTGYTGEDGFELIADQGEMPHLWERILSEGKKEGICPAGLGARDTLRTEMGYPLYGHELSEEIDPLQAGLGFFVDLQNQISLERVPCSKEKQGIGSMQCCFSHAGKIGPTTTRIPCS